MYLKTLFPLCKSRVHQRDLGPRNASGFIVWTLKGFFLRRSFWPLDFLISEVICPEILHLLDICLKISEAVWPRCLPH